jgi:hypothetical protein
MSAMLMPSSIYAVKLKAKADIEHAQRLRYQVWKHEGVMLCADNGGMIADEHDDHGLHWGVFDGNRLVAAARLCLHHQIQEVPDAQMFQRVSLPLPAASMNRLVVLNEYRGCGIGTMFDTLRIREAERLGAWVVIAAPVDIEPRRRKLRNLGFIFLDSVTGYAAWSSSVRICACYKVLSPGRTHV